MDRRDPRERFTIRPLAEADLGEMVKVWADSGLPCKPSGRDCLEGLEAQLERDPGLFIGAFSGSRMIGAVIASDDGRKGWINRLAVLPEHRRMGVGTALVGECERILRERGRCVFCILIEGENEGSAQLFLKSGYRDERDIRYYAKRDSEEA